MPLVKKPEMLIEAEKILIEKILILLEEHWRTHCVTPPQNRDSDEYRKFVFMRAAWLAMHGKVRGRYRIFESKEMREMTNTLSKVIVSMEDAIDRSYLGFMIASGLYDSDVDISEISDKGPSVLKGSDFAGWDFSKADLTGVDLSEVLNIEKARFSELSNLDKAILPEDITIEQLVHT